MITVCSGGWWRDLLFISVYFHTYHIILLINYIIIIYIINCNTSIPSKLKSIIPTSPYPILNYIRHILYNHISRHTFHQIFDSSKTLKKINKKMESVQTFIITWDRGLVRPINHRLIKKAISSI